MPLAPLPVSRKVAALLRSIARASPANGPVVGAEKPRIALPLASKVAPCCPAVQVTGALGVPHVMKIVTPVPSSWVVELPDRSHLAPVPATMYRPAASVQVLLRRSTDP